jgi:hypothetical protein
MQISGELMYGASQHGVSTTDVSAAGPGRAMLVIALGSIGALSFGGLGAALATQGVPYLIGFGAVIGLMTGVGVEFVRRPLGEPMTANEIASSSHASFLLVVVLSAVGALAFAGLGLAFASQGIAYLAGFGGVLGLLFGVSMETVYLTADKNTSTQPWRLHLMVAPAFIAALAFGGLGAGLAKQGVAYLIAFGGVLGLLVGVGVEVVRRPLPALPAREVVVTTTVPASAGVMTGMFMDFTQTGKKPLVDVSAASTAANSFATGSGANSFATDLTASMASTGR